MLIPNYQIHNILKDFTQQLKNGQRDQDSDRRLKTVVNKVADTIVDRVTHLGEEESLRQTDTADSRNRRSRGAARPKPAGTFHYHTMGKNRQKQRQHLAVENPEELINRFQSVIDEAD